MHARIFFSLRWMAFGGVQENQGGSYLIQLDVLCGCEVEGFFFFCFLVFGWSQVEETCKKNLKIKHSLKIIF